MKNNKLFTSILFIVFGFFIANASIPYSGFFTIDIDKGIIPKRLEYKFKRDAARLALRLMMQEEDLKYQGAYIDREIIDELYQKLVLIYTESEEGKRVVNCDVHTHPDISIDRFKLIYDTNIEWASFLNEGINETGSEELNSLLEKYNLVIEKHVKWEDDEDALILKSRIPMNIASVSMEFMDIEGINNVEIDSPKMKGNDIGIFRLDNGWKFTFKLAIGAQFGNNPKSHIWTFEVSDNNRVDFIEEKGNEIPAYLKCGTDGVLLSSI